MAQTYGTISAEVKGVKFQEFSSVSALPPAGTYGDGLALVNDVIYKSDSIKWVKVSGASEYATMSDFTASGGAAANPGPNWVAGKLSFSKDGFLNDPVNKKVTNFRLLEDFSPNRQKTYTFGSSGGPAVNGSWNTSEYLTERGARLTLIYDGTGTDNQYIEAVNMYSTSYGGYSYDASSPIIITIYVHSATTNNTQFGIYFSNTSFAAAPSPDEVISLGVLQPGFHSIALPRRLFHTWNATDETGQNFKKIRVYLRAAAGSVGETHDVTVLGVYQGRQIPDVVISFDDAVQTVYTNAFPLMQSLGLKGSVSVIASTIGKTYETYPSMTLDQLKELYDAGWELTVHGTMQHSVLSTESAITSDIAVNKAILVNNGLTGSEDIYIYPGGSVVTAGNASYNALAANGMTSAWTITAITESFIGEGIRSNYQRDRYRLSRQKLSQDDFTPNLNAFQNFMDCYEDRIPKAYFAHGVITGSTVDSGRESTDISMLYFEQFVRRFATYKNMGMVRDSSYREMLANAPTAGEYQP